MYYTFFLIVFTLREVETYASFLTEIEGLFFSSKPLFFKIYLFERERVHMRGGEGEGQRESQADSPSSAEPNAWLDPRTLRS